MNPFTVLRESAYFFSHNLLPIARLCLPLLLLEGLLRQQLADSSLQLAPEASELLVTLLCYPLYSAALILFLHARSQQLPAAPLQLLSQALQLWPRFALLAGLSTLLIMLGSYLLILPGLWVMLRLLFAEYLLTLDGLAPLAAMHASFRLSRGYFWLCAVCIFSVMPPLWLLDWWSFQQLGEHPDALAQILLDAGNGFLQLFVSVVGYRLFMLRRQQPASDASAA
ncbi:hypothetical protein ISX93_12845 [Pseudomonas sp. N040]|nr:hypothetical protein [Pseudomonas sp. N040]MBW7014599.1 hypothetical protein [Pseudomonas sp. N040]